MKRTKCTLEQILPLLGGILPIKIVVVEEKNEKPCSCRRAESKKSCCCNRKRVNNLFTEWDEDGNVCLGHKDFYQSNKNDRNFNRCNNWGEPSPVIKRTPAELRQQDNNPEPDGIVVNVKRPHREDFNSQSAYASALSKFRMLEDLAHSINWGGVENHTPISPYWRNDRRWQQCPQPTHAPSICSCNEWDDDDDDFFGDDDPWWV